MKSLFRRMWLVFTRWRHQSIILQPETFMRISFKRKIKLEFRLNLVGIWFHLQLRFSWIWNIRLRISNIWWPNLFWIINKFSAIFRQRTFYSINIWIKVDSYSVRLGVCNLRPFLSTDFLWIFELNHQKLCEFDN